MIVAKTNQWAERDKAKDDGDDNLNNQSVGRYAADKDARFGCKGKQKYWFGYKRHVSCDMRRGMITKVAVTPANVTDSGADAAAVLRAKGCHNGSIKKRNMKGKDRDRDRFLTRLRMPYESVFSKQSKRSRYRGLVKNQFQAFMQATAYNIKRWATVVAMGLRTSPQPTLA